MQRKWTGKWIWRKDTREINAHVLFRKDFELAAAPAAAADARLLVAAESFAVVWINGVRLHFTTSLSYPSQHYWEEADVGTALRAGTNRIAILVRYIGISSGSSCPKDPGLLCELEIRGVGGVAAAGPGETPIPSAAGGPQGAQEQSVGNPDVRRDSPRGAPLVVVTDASWRVLGLDAWLGRQRRSEWHNLDLIEIMDYGRLPAGWPMVEDLSHFEAPHVEGIPGVRLGRLEQRPFPKAVLSDLRDLKVLKAGTVEDQSAKHAIPALAVSDEEIAPGDLSIGREGGPAASDFVIQPTGEGRAAAVLMSVGGYRAGYPALEAEGSPGTTIDISYHEKLEDGRIRANDPGVYCTDRYILGAGPAQIITDEWKGLRYLQLTFRNVRAPLHIRNLRLVESQYPVRQKAFFHSSDPRLERIFEISLKAARLCMQDNIMDCPWREKRQWIGDVQRIALVNHYALTDRALVRGVLRQHAMLQDPSGRIWVCLPLLEEYPSQTMEWLRAVIEYGEFTGDGTLVDELADNVELLHRWFLKRRDAKGLFFNNVTPLINWIDHPYGAIRKYQFQTAYAPMNLRYVLFLDDVAAVLRRAGRDGEARKALAERKRLAAIIPECFLDASTGLLRDCADASIPVTHSEMAHALAIQAGVPGGPRSAAAVELWDRYLAFSVASPERATLPSPYGKWHTLEALGRLGRRDEVVQHILKDWGAMADSDTDTAWEGFDGRASECHGWSGTPVVALIRHVLKMDPRRPARKRVRNVGGVAWMECEIRE